MGDTNILKDVLGDGFSQLNEEEVSALSEKFNTKVEALIEARLGAKVQFATEVAESEAKEKYDSLLKEHTDTYEETLSKVTETVKEKSSAFVTSLEEKTETVISAITEEKENEIEEYKTWLEEKLDTYLDQELKEMLPESTIEDKAKADTLEPIVAGFKKVMEENYIKFDEENFSLIKEAKEELVKQSKEIERLTEGKLDVAKELSDMKRNVKISKVCEGLTQDQSERAERLLEDTDTDMIEEKFSYIRKDIINASTSVQEVTESVEDTDESSEEVESHEGEAVILDEDVNAPDEVDVELTEDVEVTNTDPMDEYVSDFKKLL
jgi:hypothetical protein